MNTISALIAVLAILAVIFIIYKLIRSRRNLTDSTERTINLITIWIAILVLFIAILGTLNLYGIARIPILNQVNNRLPDSYTVPDLLPPPTNGSVQPSSKPAFEKHKEDMEQIKRNGL